MPYYFNYKYIVYFHLFRQFLYEINKCVYVCACILMLPFAKCNHFDCKYNNFRIFSVISKEKILYWKWKCERKVYAAADREKTLLNVDLYVCATIISTFCIRRCFHWYWNWSVLHTLCVFVIRIRMIELWNRKWDNWTDNVW